MSITTYNGSALCAMVGKNCFAITSDRRLGVQFQTIASDYERIFKIHDKLYIGLSGLGTNVQTLFGPYFCKPIIGGLSEDNMPFICTMDLIGAKQLSSDFVVPGTSSKSLYGACESMYKPDLEPDELFEVIAQALLSSIDHDCVSGWGGIIHIVTPDQVITKKLKGRMD